MQKLIEFSLNHHISGVKMVLKKIRRGISVRCCQNIVFIKNFYRFLRMGGNNRFLLNWRDRFPCLKDNTKTTSFDTHYIYHTAWAARILAQTRPNEHVDISSALYFSTLVSAFIPMHFYDYRPASITLEGLSVDQCDLLSLPFEDGSFQSLSCMHVVEHIGLGRYGDTLNPDGDLKAIKELIRVLAEGGNLLFVVPVGKPKIRFNAHRIYSYEQIASYFSNLELKQFALIDDHGNYHMNVNTSLSRSQDYACGCWWFIKP